MPTYDYVCENGHRFERFQSMKDEPLAKCVECEAPARRLIGPGAGFLFKGGGFYITDYRSQAYKDKAKSESKAGDAASKTTPGTKSDAAASGTGAKDTSSSSTASGEGSGKGGPGADKGAGKGPSKGSGSGGSGKGSND